MDRLDQIFRALGRLEAQNEEIVRKQEEHNEETRALREDVSAVKLSISSMQTELKEAMPVVNRVQKWEQRVIGVSLVGGLLGGGLFAKIYGWFG